MSEALMNLILTILAAVATGAISVAVAFFQSKIKSENLNSAVARLGEAATVTVGELQQTTVAKWKEEGGGKLSKKQIEELANILYHKTIARLDQPAIELLNAVGVNIGSLITAYAEDAVRQIKNEEPVYLATAELHQG